MRRDAELPGVEQRVRGPRVLLLFLHGASAARCGAVGCCVPLTSVLPLRTVTVSVSWVFVRGAFDLCVLRGVAAWEKARALLCGVMLGVSGDSPPHPALFCPVSKYARKSTMGKCAARYCELEPGRGDHDLQVFGGHEDPGVGVWRLFRHHRDGRTLPSVRVGHFLR